MSQLLSRRCTLVLACLLVATLSTGCSLGAAARRAGGEAVEGGLEWVKSPEGQAKLIEVVTPIAEKLVDKTTDVAVSKVEDALATKTAELDKRLAEAGVKMGEIKTVGDALKAYADVRANERETGKPYEPVTGSLFTDILAALVSAFIAQRGGGVVMRRYIKDKAAELIKAGLAPKPPSS